ncbi:MAG: nitrite reductase small subunit NirD [Sphingomonadales bacterium]
MHWAEIGALEDIPRRGARLVKSPLGCIAVFRTANDEVYALEDRCPHKGGPLSQGIVHDTSVTCPLHNLVVDLETGAAGEDTVMTIPVKISAGKLFLSRAAWLKETV